MLAMERGSLVMERKMLLGIKQRAEQLASAAPGRSAELRDSSFTAITSS